MKTKTLYFIYQDSQPMVPACLLFRRNSDLSYSRSQQASIAVWADLLFASTWTEVLEQIHKD